MKVMQRFLQDLKLFSILSTVLALLLFILAYSWLKEIEVLRILFASLGSMLVGLVAIRLFYEWFASQRLYSSFQMLVDADRTGIQRTFSSLDEINLLDLINKAHHIRIAGLVVRPLSDHRVMQAIADRAKKDAKIIIILGDPRSERVQNRYKDEPPFEPETGLRGLPGRIERLYRIKMSLQPEKQPNFEMRISQNYPTMVVMNFDDEVLTYFYAYKMRGSWSPVIRFHGLDRAATRFFIQHFDNIYKDSTLVTQNVIDELNLWLQKQM